MADFLSADGVTALKFSRETVIPPSIEEAPAKAAWPPDLMAKGHWVRRDMSTWTET